MKKMKIPPEYEDLFRHDPRLVLTHNGFLHSPNDTEIFRGKIVHKDEIQKIHRKKSFVGKPVLILRDEFRNKTCKGCGSYSNLLIGDSDGYHYCESCMKYPANNRRVHDYHCRCSHCSKVISLPSDKEEGDLLLGAELELNLIPEVGKFFTDRSTVEHDGSINLFGGEIITSPMTLEEHVEFWNERDMKGCSASVPVFKERRNPWHEVGNQSPRDEHGLHVHVSRGCMSQDKWEKLVLAVWLNMEKLVSHIGGRPGGQYRSFDPQNLHYTGSNEMRILHAMRNYDFNSHGVAINPRKKTIEFRFPKSSTDKRVILGRIGMMDAMVHFAHSQPENLDWSQWTADDFLKFMKSNKRWAYTVALAKSNKQP